MVTDSAYRGSHASKWSGQILRWSRSRAGCGLQVVRSAAIDNHVIERAAEALFEFVFSRCNRLDGKRCWADCDEKTKSGFRREASAALEATWPIMVRKLRYR